MTQRQFHYITKIHKHLTIIWVFKAGNSKNPLLDHLSYTEHTPTWYYLVFILVAVNTTHENHSIIRKINCDVITIMMINMIILPSSMRQYSLKQLTLLFCSYWQNRAFIARPKATCYSVPFQHNVEEHNSLCTTVCQIWFSVETLFPFFHQQHSETCEGTANWWQDYSAHWQAPKKQHPQQTGAQMATNFLQQANSGLNHRMAVHM